jgi:hypothetical protein
MVKVRILTGMTAASAAVLALPGLVGCTAPTEDSVATGSQNNTESVAGAGQLVMHGYSLSYQSTSGGDEFVRVGERLKAAVDFNDTVHLIAYGALGDAALEKALRADSSSLKVNLLVTFTRADGTTYDAPPSPLAWKPSASNQLAGLSDELIVPAGVRAMRVELAATFPHAGIPQTMNLLQSQGIQRDFVVFGAFVPNKLALFDTAGADRRTRVVEGGKIVPGAHATLSVTDWRLDTVSDKSTLDLRCGQRNSYNRFGPMIVDALGTLEYEVSAVVSTDGGATYSPVGLVKNAQSPIFSRADGFRFTHDAEVPIPKNAGPNLKVAFHVRAFLQVPSFQPGEIQNARYAPGARILLKDTWDNNGGKDYALPVGTE